MKKYFTLAPIFKDNMMFQADKPIRIFGTCKKGIEIRVDFPNRDTKIKTKSETFVIELDPMMATEKGFSFTVKAKKQEETYYNCLVGDIFLFIGGTNIDQQLKDSDHSEDLISNSIRILNIENINGDLDYTWKIAGRDTFYDYSALAYVFAKQLSYNVKTPIGIIACSMRNETIFSFLSEQDIQTHLHVYEFVKNHQDERNDLSISQMYDSLICEIVPFSIKTIIIYQGENDYLHSDLYEACLTRLIKSFRIHFKDLELPYVIVQIAGYHYSETTDENISKIRCIQNEIVSEQHKIYLASAIDIGEKDSLQLRNKYVLTKRIANVVLDKIYMKSKNSISPSFYSYKKKDDGIVIYTKNNYLDLVSKSGNNLGFTATKDGVNFYDLKSVHIIANTIFIKNVKEVKEVRYACLRYPVCDIFTTNDLPLLPFRIQLV